MGIEPEPFSSDSRLLRLTTIIKKSSRMLVDELTKYAARFGEQSRGKMSTGWFEDFPSVLYILWHKILKSLAIETFGESIVGKGWKWIRDSQVLPTNNPEKIDFLQLEQDVRLFSSENAAVFVNIHCYVFPYKATNSCFEILVLEHLILYSFLLLLTVLPFFWSLTGGAWFRIIKDTTSNFSNKSMTRIFTVKKHYIYKIKSKTCLYRVEQLFSLVATTGGGDSGWLAVISVIGFFCLIATNSDPRQTHFLEIQWRWVLFRWKRIWFIHLILPIFALFWFIQQIFQNVPIWRTILQN